MKRSGSKLLCILLLLSLLLSLTACGKPETQLEKTAGYLQAQIAEPGTGSVGGDWLIFGLARSGVKVPQKYFDAYYENVEAAVREKNGVLSDRKYTEYSRTVLALTAIGKNPADVAGFDLLKPLADFEQVTRQGINGTIFALLALDSGNYEIPENPDAAVQATRQMYVDELLARALPDGGWTLTGGEPDVDITAMTLQALAKYRDQADVTAAVERGLAVLSSLQEPDGGYVSWGSSNSAPDTSAETYHIEFRYGSDAEAHGSAACQAKKAQGKTCQTHQQDGQYCCRSSGSGFCHLRCGCADRAEPDFKSG